MVYFSHFALFTLACDLLCLLLFVIYIIDIDEFTVSHILKFADDTKIYHVVNSSTAIENLRSDLHNLVVWSDEWQGAHGQ